jgi:hypothetical protein
LQLSFLGSLVDSPWWHAPEDHCYQQILVKQLNCCMANKENIVFVYFVGLGLTLYFILGHYYMHMITLTHGVYTILDSSLNQQIDFRTHLSD